MMTDKSRHRRTAGRAAKRAARSRAPVSTAAWVDRRIPYFELLDEESLQLIEYNADTVLEEIGVEFREFPRALELLRDAGADVDGERVRFPRGLCRSIVQASAPKEFMQRARNPARSTLIGGDRTVFGPAYGSPFVHDLDHGRRYATLKDFENFVKLAYLSPGLHHPGGTLCEPVNLPCVRDRRPPQLRGVSVPLDSRRRPRVQSVLRIKLPVTANDALPASAFKMHSPQLAV